MSSSYTEPLTSSNRLPFDWLDIAGKLGFFPETDLDLFDDVPEFTSTWAEMRDLVPLRPDKPLDTSGVEFSTAYTARLSKEVFQMMESLFLCEFDDLQAWQEDWKMKNYVRCVVYRAMRKLALPQGSFGFLFEQDAPRHAREHKSGTAYVTALARIQGVAMLVMNLVCDYGSNAPSTFMREIEAREPAKNPQYSPIPEVRRKWQLNGMHIGGIKTLLIEEWKRQGKTEKEGLVGTLLEMEARAAKEKADEGESVYGFVRREKRAVSSTEQAEPAIKRRAVD